MHYRQCVLERDTDQGKMITTSWLPERHKGVKIEPGVRCTLVDMETKAEDPESWTVVSVGAQRIPERDIKERSRNWSTWRSQTDI